MAVPSLASRIRGSLYGVACVDALGGPVEFRQRGTFPLVTTFKYNPNFDLPPGAWTDDTSMTLCLAQSIVEKGGSLDILDQVKKYIAWFRKGYMSSSPKGYAFDVGNATRVALTTWENAILQDEQTAEVLGQQRIDRDLNKEVRCGNGSLMRTAPIALAYFRQGQSAVDDYTARAGRPTHPHALCVEACQVYVRLICQILSEDGKHVSKQTLFNTIKQFNFREAKLRDVFAVYENMEALVNAPESAIHSSGFVVDTLEAALWSFFSTSSFRDGAIKVVNLGDDADTVGAVYGGLGGAYYGVEEIPSEWLNGLQAKSTVDGVVEGLTAMIPQAP